MSERRGAPILSEIGIGLLALAGVGAACWMVGALVLRAYTGAWFWEPLP